MSIALTLETAEVRVDRPCLIRLDVMRGDAIAADYRGTVYLETNAGPVLPGSYTYTAADAGSRTFEVQFDSVGRFAISVVGDDVERSSSLAVQVAAPPPPPPAPPSPPAVQSELVRATSLGTGAFRCADFDGDGDVDMVVAAPEAQLLRNNDGELETWTTFGGSWVDLTLADVDADQDLDVIAILAETLEARVWRNDGDGRFTELSGDAGRSMAFVEAGDLDGDGDIDLVRASATKLEVWIGDGEGAFEFRERFEVEKLTCLQLADLTGNGALDIVSGHGEAPNRMWRNDGFGRFGDTGQRFGNEDTRVLRTADFDLDGDIDIVTGNWGQLNRVWLNDGDGTFQVGKSALGENCTLGIALLDLDFDGDLDVVTGNYTRSCDLWINNGDGTFGLLETRLDMLWTSHLDAADFDGDGVDDLFQHAGGFLNIYLVKRP